MQEARKDLGLLINSEYPIISLETWEEGRATELLGQIAGDLHVPLFAWTVTEGMARAGGAPIYNTLEPAQVLAQIGTMDGDGLYLLKDFHKYFNQDAIVRKLRDLAHVSAAPAAPSSSLHRRPISRPNSRKKSPTSSSTFRRSLNSLDWFRRSSVSSRRAGT